MTANRGSVSGNEEMGNAIMRRSASLDRAKELGCKARAKGKGKGKVELPLFLLWCGN